jgi:hypothetical protein
MSVSVRLQIEGVDDLRRDLRRFAPDLERRLTGVLRGETRRLAAASRAAMPSDAPLSGWARAWQGDRLRWSTSAARSGIRGSVSSRRSRLGFVTVAAVTQSNPAGAVFEVASSSDFGARISSRWGGAGSGRVIRPTVEANRGRTETLIRSAVQETGQALTQRIAGGSL